MVDSKASKVVMDKVDVVFSQERLWDGSGDEVVRRKVRRKVGLVRECLGVLPN